MIHMRDNTISIYNIASTRKQLMSKYAKGIITNEESKILNEIEFQIDKIVKQRRRERKQPYY